MEEEYTNYQSKIEKILEKKKKIAKDGEKTWNRIRSKISSMDEYILLFPDGDDEVLKYGMIYMDMFAMRNGIDKICVCTDSKFVKKHIDKYASTLDELIMLSKTEVNALIQFYSYFRFDDKFQVISLNKPNCRNALNMVGKNQVTKEQLVAIGIYRIIPFEKISIGEGVI